MGNISALQRRKKKEKKKRRKKQTEKQKTTKTYDDPEIEAGSTAWKTTIPSMQTQYVGL